MTPKLQPRRQGDLPTPKGTQHRLIRELRAEARRQGVTEGSVCRAAGVYEQGLNRNLTKIPTLELLGEVLGFELKWVKK